MSDMLENTLPTGRFDRAAWLLMAALLALTAVVVWRGDQVGLSVVTMAPAPESAGVSPRTQLHIRFDQPLDEATVDNASLALSPSVDGTVRAEGNTLFFDPVGALMPDTTYRVEIAAGLQSVQGRLLHDPITWDFVTGHTSIAYSQIDANGREQLFRAPISLPTVEDGPDASVSTSTPEQLTQADFGLWDFTVDGHTGQIVYSQLTETGTGDLWTLIPGEQAPSLLLACPEAACGGASFSPDSQLLAFSQRNASDYGSAIVSPPRLYLLELAAGTVAPVFADSQQLAFEPRWSPDGKWLSYLSPDVGGIGVYHLENGTTRFYPTTTGETATWHPLRNELILSEMLTSGQYYEIHLVRIDPLTETRQELSVAEYPVEDNSPAFSPNGEWIAFRRKELAGPRESLGKQLWIMREDGTGARPLTQDPGLDHGAPLWSPDGRYLLYHRFPLRGPDVVISAWVMDVESGQSWEVARPGQRPQWIP